MEVLPWSARSPREDVYTKELRASLAAYREATR